jgi:hypothetical protein
VSGESYFPELNRFNQCPKCGGTSREIRFREHPIRAYAGHGFGWPDSAGWRLGVPYGQEHFEVVCLTCGAIYIEVPAGRLVLKRIDEPEPPRRPWWRKLFPRSTDAR